MSLVVESYLDATDIVNAIRYKRGWHLMFRRPTDWEVQMYWVFTAPDADDPFKVGTHESATVIISLPTTEETIVREAYALALRAEQHEAGEFFTYKGQRPFDPHVSVLTPGARYG